MLSATLSEAAPAEATSEAAMTSALALPVSPMIAGILLIPSILISAIVGITAIRVFASDKTETIPEEFYKRNLVSALLKMLAGGLVFGVLLFAVLGLSALPGGILTLTGLTPIGPILAGLGVLIGLPLMLYVLLSLYFWTFYVVLEDQNFVEGFKNSWELTKGHKLGLLILGIAVFLVSISVSLFSEIPGIFRLETVGVLLGIVIGAFTSAFSTATLAQAYNQLKSA